MTRTPSKKSNDRNRPAAILVDHIDPLERPGTTYYYYSHGSAVPFTRLRTVLIYFRQVSGVLYNSAKWISTVVERGGGSSGQFIPRSPQDGSGVAEMVYWSRWAKGP